MKKLPLILGLILTFLLAVNAQAGHIITPHGNLDPGIARPHSNAFGKSLDEWMGVYYRWLADGADPDARVRNVGFLPIVGESPFQVTVKSGTALVLPVFGWLVADPNEKPLPNWWFGDRDHIFGRVYLDGERILQPNAKYYVGPTNFDPPLPLWGYEIVYYQSLVLIINPLPPGEHLLRLHSEFKDYEVKFDNVWNITVLP